MPRGGGGASDRRKVCGDEDGLGFGVRSVGFGFGFGLVGWVVVVVEEED